MRDEQPEDVEVVLHPRVALLEPEAEIVERLGKVYPGIDPGQLKFNTVFVSVARTTTVLKRLYQNLKASLYVMMDPTIPGQTLL